MNSVLDGLTSNVHSLLYVLYITRLYIYILLYQGADPWMHDSKSSYYSHLGVHVCLANM